MPLASTGVGWGVTKPGHGLAFVRLNNKDAGIASAVFAHKGKHAPMLVLLGSTLPASLHQYIQTLKPRFKKEPTEEPYNHGFVIGREKSIPFDVQGND